MLLELEKEKKLAAKIQAAQAYLKKLGFRSFQVQVYGSGAKIQVGPKELYLAVAQQAKIRLRFSLLGLRSVYLDLEPLGSKH